MDPNLLDAETATTQTTKPASIPHSYTNSLRIKVFFLLLGQGAVQEERLLALHPSALSKGGHGNSRQDIQGTQNWLNSTLLYPVMSNWGFQQGKNKILLLSITKH